MPIGAGNGLENYFTQTSQVLKKKLRGGLSVFARLSSQQLVVLYDKRETLTFQSGAITPTNIKVALIIRLPLQRLLPVSLTTLNYKDHRIIFPKHYIVIK